MGSQAVKASTILRWARGSPKWVGRKQDRVDVSSSQNWTEREESAWPESAETWAPTSTDNVYMFPNYCALIKHKTASLWHCRNNWHNTKQSRQWEIKTTPELFVKTQLQPEWKARVLSFFFRNRHSLEHGCETALGQLWQRWMFF